MFCWKIITLKIKDYTISKVEASHHQRNVRYGISRGIQWSSMSLMSFTSTLFRSPGMWDKFDLDCILGKGDQLENLDTSEWKTYHKSSW